MGGSGSGSWYRCRTKSTDENFHRFSIARLKKLGVIGDSKWRCGTWQWSRGGDVVSSIGYELNMWDETFPWLRVHYDCKSRDEKHDYKIPLCTTHPHYGGVRWWFKCPRCYRRVGVLYLANVLACRHCWDMAYQSQNQAAHDRYTDKAFRLAKKLGHYGNVIDGFYGNKPKGMHRRIYDRKVAELDYAAKMGRNCFIGRFGSELIL